jgi:hypothetical protein
MPASAIDDSRRIWPGGPLRRWSATPASGFDAHVGGGFVAAYVCDVCRRPVVGIYHVDELWECAECRKLAGGERVASDSKDGV